MLSLEYYFIFYKYFREIFINPVTNDTWKEGDYYKRPNFAQTLRHLAESGATEFYSGKTAEKMVKDLSDRGGILSLQDLKNYE